MTGDRLHFISAPPIGSTIRIEPRRSEPITAHRPPKGRRHTLPPIYQPRSINIKRHNSMPERSVSRYGDDLISSLESTGYNQFAQTPRDLISTSTPVTFTTGTGSAIYNTLHPLLESTNHELILVTCFWARSSTLSTLNSVLRKLSDKAIRRGTSKIRVRLCFSSLSLFQKLFHNQTLSGQTYAPKVWEEKLGLPSPDELSGLDLQIKSVFILPFSVMHPKFMVIDRKMVALPSCNISWEEWFEGCMTMSGPIVNLFLDFYCRFWERREELERMDHNNRHLNIETLPVSQNGVNSTGHDASTDGRHGYAIANFNPGKTIPTIFLPSPHHRYPDFQPFTPAEKMRFPPTPLNSMILLLVDKAHRSIQIQTPNLTSPPVLSALLRALARGIDVRILTSEKLMILEQLVTAGTTTTRCVKKLARRYEKLVSSSRPARSSSQDEEAVIGTSPAKPGRLRISYFLPVGGSKKRGEEGGEPQQSHLKMLIVDDEVVVLGSGNLDRASWFTSQELGVAFFDTQVVREVKGVVERGIQKREKVVFESG